ncbi:MAG: DMT family transporter [Pseudomonadota bacterium]
MLGAAGNAKGALFMAIAMAAFAINDGFLKLAFETLPVAQSIFVRGLMASTIIVLVCWYVGALKFRPAKGERGPIAWRVIGELGATGTFMLALAHVDIGTATAVLQAAPLAVTMAAALLLGEPVGWRRWTAIAVGFCGTLLIVRPGGGVSIWLVFAVIAVGFITLRDIATRIMSTRVPTLYLSALSAVAITVGAFLLTPIEGWVTLSLRQVAPLMCSAILILVGYTFITLAMRRGEISVVAPFRYTVLVVAIGVGYLFFGTLPDTLTLIGAAIIVGAGLYTIYREWKLRRDRSAFAPRRRSSSAG